MAELSQSIQDDIRAAEPGWVAALQRCTTCGYKCATVHPVECDETRLECGRCGAFTSELISKEEFREGVS